MDDYRARPDYEGWTYESIDVARQRLIWYLSTHGLDSGTISRGKSRIGLIYKKDDMWIWKPTGKKKEQRVDPANGKVR